jgi:hypothetical protein
MSTLKSNDFCGMVLRMQTHSSILYQSYANIKAFQFEVQEAHHGKWENTSPIQKQQRENIKYLN